MTSNPDVLFLHKALELAYIRKGFCAPNPAVGAVIVKNNRVIATGYHEGPGLDHAEVSALRKLDSEDARGATIYVTLEPCCHHGRTPPCTDALLQAGIERVVYGFCDPNPIVAGNGHRLLERSGIIVQHIPTEKINSFYASYQHWHQTKNPFLTAKIALSLDGKIAAKTGEPLKITGTDLQIFTHARRREADAILTTSKTIITDDPQLNVRTQDEIIAKDLYVLDSSLVLPMTAKIFNTAQSVTIFHAAKVSHERCYEFENIGVRCIPIENTPSGLDLRQIVTFLGHEGKQDVWVEAGGQCFSAFMAENLLQRAFIYVAPVWFSDGIAAFTKSFDLNTRVNALQWRQYGKDVLCEMMF